MKDFFDEWGGLIFTAVVVLVLVVCTIYVLDRATCEAQTARIGYPHEYDLVAGCMIEVNPGQWIPLDSYYFKQE